jgi:hypothetical protein
MNNHKELTKVLGTSLFAEYLAGVSLVPIPGNLFEQRAIKIGDTLDFGSINLSLRNLWKGLQASKPENTIRIIGRQAFYQLLGLSSEIGMDAIPGFAEEVFLELRNGSLKAAHSEGGLLYSFAGFDMDSFPEYLGWSTVDIADHINRRFQIILADLVTMPEGMTEARDRCERIRVFNQDPLFAHFGIFEAEQDISNPWFAQVTARGLLNVG